MVLEITVEAKQILEVLSKRWEEKERDYNKKLLLHLYKSENAVLKKHKNFYAIELHILDEDFVGSGKKFKTRWELILAISNIARANKYRAIRLLFPTGTILIIHAPGAEKFPVLSILRNGDRWVYKAFRSAQNFVSESRVRAGGVAKTGIPYARWLIGMPERTIKGEKKPAFVKEEYGGVELPELWALATPEEKEKLKKITEGLIIDIWTEKNYTYNPATKKIYQVDVL